MEKLIHKNIIPCVALLLAIVSSCSEPEPRLNNVSFDYSDSHAGHFKIYDINNLSKAGVLTMTILHDTTLMFYGVEWNGVDSVGDMISFTIHNSNAFGNEQVFSSDSLNISSSVGINAPISLTRSINGGDSYRVTDTTGYFSTNMVLRLSKFLSDSTISPFVLMQATFSGTFKNSKGEKLTISNGSIDFQPHP